MKKIFSLAACGIICLALLHFRITNSDLRGGAPLKVTVWDAFGYYVYLPSAFIYNDCKQLNWLAEIDKKYSVTGGNGWQAEKLSNGNYTFKYLGGVALMETPFFLMAHVYAKNSHYPPDGFSTPYQYALGFGVIVYCLVALLLLRQMLLSYFSDLTTAITLLMLCLATNFIQYAAVDNGQSHGYIFPLYAFVLYTTWRWHKKPSLLWAVLTGYIVGLATISRPTEAIMVLIPILWDTHTKDAAREKWGKVKQYKMQVALAGIAGIIGITPQLIYWKMTTGSFLYDVGSKWEFLSPHFRVLFGWEKGWFIYTPVTVFFIAGMFLIKRFPFRKSVLWFCLLNIYIIIAWHDWRYGGSYSTRALVQSYPVFALPFAALVDKAVASKWRIPFYLLCAYLLFVNLFQTNQYNQTVLHFNDMNRLYYSHIYLNPNPSPADMSLLDNEEMLNSEAGYNRTVIAHSDSNIHLVVPANSPGTLAATMIAATGNHNWLKIESDIKAPDCLWQTYLIAELLVGDSVKLARTRLFSPISINGQTNKYVFYMQVTPYFARSNFRLFVASSFNFDGVVEKFSVTELQK